MPRGHYDRKKAAKRGTGKKAVATKTTVELQLNSREAQVLRALVARLPDETAGGRMSAFGLAMTLAPGEEGVATGPGATAGAFAAALKSARIAGILEKREFVYRSSAFSPGVGIAAIAVLYFKRLK